MKNKYDSFKYWENLISENKTIRGHMFMNELPTEKKLIYTHVNFFKIQWIKKYMELLSKMKWLLLDIYSIHSCKKLFIYG